MPQLTKSDLPKNFPPVTYLTMNNWKKGVITLIDKSRLPKDALDEAENIFLVEDGQPSPRPGVGWFSSALPNAAEIDGFDYFDYSGVIHIVAAGGGKIYRSTDDGANWTECTGATYSTASDEVNFNQYDSKLYITSGEDYPIIYDGTTTIYQYTSLATPAAPTIVETGLASSGEQFYYKAVRTSVVGVSAASTDSLVVSTNLPRSAWDDTTNFATLTMPAFVTDQTGYDIYMTEQTPTGDPEVDNQFYYYLGSTTNTIYKDNGGATINTSVTAPVDSSAEGPKVKYLTNVGTRMYGVQDKDNPYRIWFTSGVSPYGAFTEGFGGGFLEWQKGGKFKPVKVEDYRDGKGTNIATIWCDSADGQGSIIQMSLDEVTIDVYTATIPSAYKLPGSRGTPAAGSVVNVLNDYFFYNSQAIYNLGSRAQFLNLLSTDEASANIRPTIKQVRSSAEHKITSTYFDAKVLFSMPRGADDNNRTAVFDTERRAWLPDAFTLGFKRFLKYTDTSGTQRLLATKPGDTKISEISSGIQGDYGVPFNTTLTTALLSTSKNRAEFQFTEQAECEFSQPQGSINIELLGVERTKGFVSNKSTTLAPRLSMYGWDSFDWDSTLWDDTTLVGSTYSESSVWRYFTVMRELRSVQWRITTTSLDAAYVLRTLQTWGTDTQGGLPRQERLT